MWFIQQETLRPIDRVKNFVKLSNSVFVSCERVEAVFIGHEPIVEWIYVHAASDMDRCQCVVRAWHDRECVYVCLILWL